MSYHFAKTLALRFDEAVRRTIEGLKQEGFGIITEIDVKETFKKKINVYSAITASWRVQSDASLMKHCSWKTRSGQCSPATSWYRMLAEGGRKWLQLIRWPPCKPSQIRA